MNRVKLRTCQNNRGDVLVSVLKFDQIDCR